VKVKIVISFIFTIILVLGSFFTWTTYLEPVDKTTISGFKTTLERKGYTVKDDTKQYEIRTKNKLPNNLYYLSVDGVSIEVKVCKSKTLVSDIAVQKSVLTSPLLSGPGQPHLYNKGYLMVIYFEQGNKKLLKPLQEILGKSLIN
jgi:hypothetical protein